MPGRIEELFSIRCEPAIWQSFLDEKEGLLLIQIRDQQLHQTTFSLLDLRSGNVNIQNKAFEEEWWVNVESFENSHALMSVYEDEQNPEFKSYFLWNTKTGEVSSMLENYQWLGNSTQGYVFKNRLKESFVVLGMNGILTLAASPELSPLDDTTEAVYPFEYRKDHDSFEVVKRFVATLLNVHPELGVEYLEWDDKVFLSYYINENGDLANYLLVSDMDGGIILNKKINTGVKGMGKDTFFIFDSKLIFVSYGNLISCYAL